MTIIINSYRFATSGGGGSGPGSVAGLVWWVKADAITGLSDGDDVATWEDQSSSGIDATEASLYPVYKTNIVNGHPVVRFSSGDRMVLASNPLTGASAGTAFFVIEVDSSAVKNGHMTNYIGSASGDSHYSFNNGLVYDAWGSTSRKDGLSGGAAITSWHIYEVVSQAGSWVAARNGTEIFSTATNTVGWGGSPRLAYGNAANSHFWAGDMAEIVFYDTALSSTDRDTVRNSLASKYGITVA